MPELPFWIFAGGPLDPSFLGAVTGLVTETSEVVPTLPVLATVLVSFAGPAVTVMLLSAVLNLSFNLL
jgi:hypothetical protein